MPSYTSEFRESVVRSVLSKECRDAAEAAAKYGCSEHSVKRWIAQCQPTDVQKPAKASKAVTKATKPPLPSGWTLAQGIEAVGARNAFGDDTDAYGAYCRRMGIRTTDIDAIDQWVKDNGGVMGVQQHQEAMVDFHRTKKELASLGAELSRKDKALSDAATMLVLSKKAEAIWGARRN